jgi:hypothetical protein
MATDDDTPLTPCTFGVTAHAAYEALEPLRQVCAAHLDMLAAEMGLPPPSQDVRTFLARRARDPQFWRLMQALRADEVSEKGKTDE